MAHKRMFSLDIIDSDSFLDMPQSSQLLYFHFGMKADDDGFIGNPKRVMRMIGANDDDFKILLAKRFILKFDSGVIVIKHWRINNYIPKDRYHETRYLDEKRLLSIKSNSSYTDRIQSVYDMDTENRREENRINNKDVNKSNQIKALNQLRQTLKGKIKGIK